MGGLFYHKNMNIYIAEKTLKAIEEAVAQDQGAAYRQILQKVLPHIGDAYRGIDSPFRAHLGASVIGGKCPRAIWYGFHWMKKPKFNARLLRLFNRGHLEEGRLIALLLTIGVQVYQQDANGKQFRISDAGGHFGGSGDGVAVGIPDLPPNVPALLEFKTHNDKSFAKLSEAGVRAAKFEHFVQMQMYMRKMAIAVALYMAVNKNNDEIYAELVPLDAELADQFLDRARNIIESQTPPARINNSPGWYECKWCDYHSICHGSAKPDRNCRTCKFGEAINTGEWYCNNLDSVHEALSMEQQLNACELYNPL